MVILAMDHINTHLATAANDPIYPVAIRSVLAVGKRTINRYYNKTDHSEVYCIAMGTSFILLTLCMLNTNLFYFSVTSSPQASVLRKGWMGT